MKGLGTALLLLAGLPGIARATVAGLCPDGSAFVVATPADAPCARAKFVEDPSQLPPLRPQLLPHPYTWHVDQQARDPNNPYNLLDRTRDIREANREPDGEPESVQKTSPSVGSGPSGRASPPEAVSAQGADRPLRLELDHDQIRDLVRLIGMRQDLAPATFFVDDAQRRETLVIRLAHSDAFENQVLAALGLAKGERTVLLFTARGERDTEFHPNFFAVRGPSTFRPDPGDPHEVGFLVGAPGALSAGTLALGYLVLPPRFDPSEPLDLWWNDRSLQVTLRP